MSSSSTETLVDVTMPQMGVSVAEGTVVEWRKQVGDWVEDEETVCEISTDKIDTEVPSPAAGGVAEMLVEAGATVEVGTVLARLATDARPGEAHAQRERNPLARSASAQSTGEAAPAPDAPGERRRKRPRARARAPRSAERRGPRRPRYTPVVQRIAAEHGIDLDR